MGKRLNDTAAISAMPVTSQMRSGESISIDVRPIDNGYVTRNSHYKDDGSYTCKETYSPTKPVIKEAMKGNTSALSSAKDYLNRK